ncbi:MAG: phosphoenolpyruvate--protein phosphotransferase [Myxococcales bacterium]|nr:MAG: phosphoenolpyruvate--protein phosphotransferase [Myxococcales bacterium]
MTRPLRLKGIAASIGVAVGPARLLGRERRRLAYKRIEDAAVSTELARFEEAVSKSREEIEVAKQELTQQHGSTYAPILDVYLLMHGDALLIDAISESIRNDGINAEWAVARVAERLRAPLLRDSSSYFRERAHDIDHVKEHLLRQLCGEHREDPSSDDPVVLVAHDLSPADAVHMLAPPTVGLVTELGAGSSHTAILARTFGVPAVVGVGALCLEIEDGEEVLVDGFAGEVGIGVSTQQREEAEARRNRFHAFLQGEHASAAVTRDGVEVTITANVELPTEIEAALESGAEGIGLYRTEFMCLDRAEPPSEDDQFEIYRAVATAMAPRNVVFRTFDWRGDKRLRAHDLGDRERLWLKTQIRAVLRASGQGSVSLMFPMVSTVDELIGAKALVEECRVELADASARSAVLPVGMMVEVPSAALLADRFAEHADFFAVGTNDLAHYTMALERGDGRASATPLDPAVLRLIANGLAAAAAADIPCSLCGDMAADPVALGLVLGLGFRSVSVPVSVVPLARAVVRNVNIEVASRVAEEALECHSAAAVRAVLADRLGERLDPLWKDPSGG